MDGFTTRLRDNWLAATLFLAAAVVLAVGLGWTMARSAPDRPVVTANATTEITPGPDAPTPSAPAADPAPPQAPAAGGGDGGSDRQPDQAAPSEPPAWPDAGPRVEEFRVAQQPLCPGGTTEYPIDGQPVRLEWRVTGTDTVTISIDGPGAFGSYPADGGAELPFACAGEEGDLQEHAYHLTAVADGVTVTETIVVTAEVHEVAEV